MGFGRLFGKTLSLTAICFFLIQCGGVGVSKRTQLEIDRPGAKKRSVSSAKEKSKSNTKSSKVLRGSSASKIEAYFMPWMNTPYLFGGNTFSGVDCSGLVNRFFAEFYGITVSRTTSALYIEANKISKGRAQPGDLVFFQNTYRPGISHVGIYIGDNRFVHAANSGVTITSLDDDYWQSHYVGFRRIDK